jgi:hypothetical protein
VDKPGSAADARVEASLDEMHRAYRAAQEVLEEESDPRVAFQVATAFADALRSLADQGAELRASTVARIWEKEATSLAGLAEKIGVSKARAGQLMQAARASRKKQSNSREER